MDTLLFADQLRIMRSRRHPAADVNLAAAGRLVIVACAASLVVVTLLSIRPGVPETAAPAGRVLAHAQEHGK